MDILDALINFFRVTDSSSLLKVNFETLRDKEEYLGERIKAFFSIVLLIICYICLIVTMYYLINYFVTN
ncbi:hypothetical protein FLAN108750_02725 [Flavobacterium antarcticum]